MKVGCPICSAKRAHQRPYMCDACQRSYTRYAFDCGDVMTALIWAARRARRSEQKKAR